MGIIEFSRLLQLIELPSLDLVLDYDPVNGEVVSDNVTFSLRMQQHQLNQSDGDKIERGELLWQHDEPPPIYSTATTN